MDAGAEWVRRFQDEWDVASSVEEVAANLGTTVSIVLKVAALFQESGCPLPFRLGVPLTYKSLTREYEGAKHFLTTWAAAESVFQVATCLGKSVGFVLRVARRLRRLGVTLKPLPLWGHGVVFGNN